MLNLNERSLDELKATKKSFYMDDLYLFAKYCLGYEDLTKKTHLPIARALQLPTKRKLICVPRGCFKSTISTIAYPMWILEHNPNARILIDSELYANSVTFLRAIKGHYESNSKFREIFGEYKRSDFPLWNESDLTIPRRFKPGIKEPSIVCSGIGAGSGKTSQHYDYVIADDLSSYINTKNPDVAKKTLENYRLYTSLLDPEGTLVIIGTRYSEIDIIGHIIEHELDIKDGNIEELKRLYCTNQKSRLIQGV